MGKFAAYLNLALAVAWLALFLIELDDVDGLQLGNRKDFEEFMDRDENKNNPMYRLLIAQDVESGPKTKSGPADKTDADGDAAE